MCARQSAYSDKLGRRYSIDPSSPVRRSKRLGQGSLSPTPSISLRATTPDVRQLHETLRAASESPTKGRSGSRARGSIQSSVTPSPPVQRTISTISTPAAPSLNPAITTDSDALEEESDHGFSFFRYPRLPSLGFGRKVVAPVLSSPIAEDSAFDNVSVISWQLERDLHRDELQRTGPTEYARESTGGRNIRKPPRRLSGLTWANDTTHSAEGHNNDNITSNGDNENGNEEKEEEEDENINDDVVKDEEDYEVEKSETPEARTAAARTVISTKAIHDSSDVSVAESLRPSTADRSITPVDRARRPPIFTGQQMKTRETRWPLFLITISLLVAALATTTYFLHDHLTPHNPFTPFPKNSQLLNATEGKIIKQLSNEVDKLGVQISSVSKDVHRLSSEQRHVVDQVTVVRPIAAFEPRINFLSLGLGTRVDPLLTSPSIGTRRTLSRRLYESLPGHGMPLPNPPETALEAWEDIGDCWCSAPGKAGQAQLALELGQLAILDEVVVEHIPASASPNPSVAPREMELWARFRPIRGQYNARPATATETVITSDTKRKAGWFGLFHSSTASSSSSSFSSKPASPSSLASLLDAIMKTLYQAYPSELETAYANDRLLGPSYFRLGKWEYDRTGDAIQHFALNALIDYPTLRVDKVVLRVKSNWGGNHTCLYRVKLHGHI